jgi:MFS family permease
VPAPIWRHGGEQAHIVASIAMSQVTGARAPNRAAILFVLLSASFITAADNSIVNVAVPAIRANLGISGGEVQFAVTIYFITFALLLITGARLGDLVGYRRVFLVGLSVFSAASLACGLAPDAIWLIAGRGVQGLGAALLAPQVLSGIQLDFEGDDRTRAVGLYSLALAGGTAAGQVLGGALVSVDLFGTSWRPIFLVNVPIGLAAIAGGLHFLPARRGASSARLDLGGVATLCLSILLFLVPLMVGRDAGWPTWAWLSLAAAAPALVLFVLWERRVARGGGYPLLNLEVVRSPVVAWGLLAQTFATVTFSGLLFVLALYLQDGLGKSALYSGLALLSWIVAFGVAGSVLGWLPRRLRSVASPLGFALLAAAYFVIGVSGVIAPPDGVFLVTMLGVGGLGIGWGFTAIVDHMAAFVSPDDAADLSGLIGTNSEVFGAVGIATFGSLYLTIAPAHGLEAALPAFIAVLVGSGVAALAAASAAYRSIVLRSASSSIPAQAARR